MSCRFPTLGIPGLPLPVDQVGRRRIIFSLPPNITIRSPSHIGENRVTGHCFHGIGVGLLIGSRHHSKITVLRINGSQASIFSGLHPGDVVPDGCDFPSLVQRGRNHHGKVRLAAGRGKRRRHVGFSSLRILHTQDQHVLRQPSLVPSQVGGDPQGEAFLAEEGVASVPRTD